MKTIATIIFIIFIGTAAQAQNNTTAINAETVEMTSVTETTNEIKLESKAEVARLYKRKFSTIKKELSFTTKRNKAKMA
ncbi:hypothetical protein ACOCEA_15565 [Maribacter sp. CXY002]|uniref:hypothetical protein n=1 Tax=Maribacter luteocoastalis TaxID=3407671 RepID=UPI003B676803